MATDRTSSGTTALREWLSKQHDATGKPGATTALAAMLGVQAPSVIAWTTGKARPEEHRWAAIEAATGIVSSLWLLQSDPQSFHERHGRAGRAA